MGSLLEMAAENLSQVPAGHLVLEGLLGLLVVYLAFFSKSYKVDKKGPGLSEGEKNELIEEWTPEPLVQPQSKSEWSPPVADG